MIENSFAQPSNLINTLTDIKIDSDISILAEIIKDKIIPEENSLSTRQRSKNIININSSSNKTVTHILNNNLKKKKRVRFENNYLKIIDIPSYKSYNFSMNLTNNHEILFNEIEKKLSCCDKLKSIIEKCVHI